MFVFCNPCACAELHQQKRMWKLCSATLTHVLSLVWMGFKFVTLTSWWNMVFVCQNCEVSLISVTFCDLWWWLTHWTSNWEYLVCAMAGSFCHVLGAGTLTLTLPYSSQEYEWELDCQGKQAKWQSTLSRKFRHTPYYWVLVKQGFDGPFSF